MDGEILTEVSLGLALLVVVLTAAAGYYFLFVADRLLYNFLGAILLPVALYFLYHHYKVRRMKS